MSDKSLARIAALLRKAESTENEFEAEAYMETAQRLATASSVDLAVARAHTHRSEQRQAPTQREIAIGDAGKRGLRTYVELYVAIAHANDITCDVARNSTRVFAYGFESDLDAAQALFASLMVQMVRASDRFIKSGAYRAELVRRYSASRRRWETGPVNAITARLSFQRAFAARIARRLHDAKAAATDEAMRADRDRHGRRRQATGTELALRAKELELAEHYRVHSTARGTWRGSSASAGHSRHAARAGDRAARQARMAAQQALDGVRPQLGR